MKQLFDPVAPQMTPAPAVTLPSSEPAPLNPDNSPKVSLGMEQFKPAATWQSVIKNPTSNINITTQPVREYGGRRHPPTSHTQKGCKLLHVSSLACLGTLLRLAQLFIQMLCDSEPS
jgi:hypothetical protein